MDNQETNKQHCYLFLYGNSNEQIAEIWCCSVPDVGETVSVYNDQSVAMYKVEQRVYGVHAGNKTSCWNLYVKEAYDDFCNINIVNENDVIDGLKKLLLVVDTLSVKNDAGGCRIYQEVKEHIEKSLKLIER